ncbi:MAG: GDSL-type esterase/lipase family protein [Opitutaceae bacterium]
MWRKIPLAGALITISLGALVAEPSRFEDTIRGFEEADRVNPPEPGGVLFVGSSSIRMWRDLEMAFPDLGPILNRGFGGSTMADLLEVTDRIVLPSRPAVIVVYEGDNDLAGKATPAEVAARFAMFLDRMAEALPETRVLILSVKPSFARWALLPQMRETNQLLTRMAVARERVEFVDVFHAMLGPGVSLAREDFSDDGLHLSARGYARWAEVLTPWLRGALD